MWVGPRIPDMRAQNDFRRLAREPVGCFSVTAGWRCVPLILLYLLMPRRVSPPRGTLPTFRRGRPSAPASSCARSDCTSYALYGNDRVKYIEALVLHEHPVYVLTMMLSAVLLLAFGVHIAQGQAVGQPCGGSFIAPTECNTGLVCVGGVCQNPVPTSPPVPFTRNPTRIPTKRPTRSPTVVVPTAPPAPTPRPPRLCLHPPPPHKITASSLHARTT